VAVPDFGQATSGELADDIDRGTRLPVVSLFSVLSFICIACSAVAIVLFFRKVAIQEIVEFGEYSNTALAEVSLSTVRPGTLEFLSQTNVVQREQLASVTLPSDLEHELTELQQTRSVERVNIYNSRGWIVYSSKPELIGNDQSASPDFRSAIAGAVTSELVYRDAFNVFDQKSEVDNLIRTYVPIRLAPGQPVLGVFEIYVDVKPRAEHVEQALIQVIVAATLIMGLLYLVLLAFVRWAEGIIARQQAQIREHARTLEVFSARMLQNQEEEKRRIAFDLHEGLAQTLSAVKMNVEAACQQLAALAPGRPSTMEPMVQAVKDAIAEVRGVALRLRPAGLDDLGLTAAIQGLCRTVAAQHADVQLELDVSLSDADFPEPLRVIIYREIEDALRVLECGTKIHFIGVEVGMEDERIVLIVRHDVAGAADAPVLDESWLDAPRERALLSGGSFHVHRNRSGGNTFRASWLT
jgi:signal transduction histidine kinase